MPKVTVIDYGIGNLLSVCRALEYCGATVELTDSPEQILKAQFLILPGVGAFADGMEGLRQRNLIPAILQYASNGNPLLGICLGMQLLMDSSEEFGNNKGLGLIPGRVVAIPPTGLNGEPHKIPHIGWNELILPNLIGTWENTILDKVKPGDSVYFVHSFTCVPSDPRYRLADCNYNGRIISAAIKSHNIYGCQFHPEKSGIIGLRIIQEFLKLTKKTVIMYGRKRLH